MRVQITGRKLVRMPGGLGRFGYRAVITWIGDGEPDTVSRGWVMPRPA